MVRPGQKPVTGIFHCSLLCLLCSLFHADEALAQPDVITLESQVVGNQEQPNVLSIVPWKFADDLSRLDQDIDLGIGRLFQHLDQDEFDRQLYFHQQFQAADDTASNTQ